MAARFSDRSAIVTGGVSGIGAGIAKRLSAEGARVSLWDHDAAGLANAEAAHKVTLDVTDASAVQRAAEDTAATLGKIDILITSAGVTGPNHPTWEYPIAAWDRVIDINLKGVFYCCHAVLPFMQTNGYGRIVNIASIAGKEGNPNASAYSASKAGVIGLTKSLGKELAATEIRVNCVTPAAVKTPIFDQMTQQQIDWMLSKIPIGRFGDGRRDGLAGPVAGERGMQLLHRCGVRHLGWTGNLLSGGPQHPVSWPRGTSRTASMNSEDLGFLPATQLAEMIRAKLLSPVETMRTLLDRITALEPKVNAFAYLAADQAMDAARAAEATLMSGERIGRLHGVPVTIKDLAITKDMPTQQGSLIHEGHQPSEDAPMVTRLKDEGAIVLGKTTTSEFGWKGVSHSPADRHHPQPLEARLQRRRVLGRSRRRRRRRIRPAAPGQRRRRFDPHAGAFLRRVRPEA